MGFIALFAFGNDFEAQIGEHFSLLAHALELRHFELGFDHPFKSRTPALHKRQEVLRFTRNIFDAGQMKGRPDSLLG